MLPDCFAHQNSGSRTGGTNARIEGDGKFPSKVDEKGKIRKGVGMFHWNCPDHGLLSIEAKHLGPDLKDESMVAQR